MVACDEVGLHSIFFNINDHASLQMDKGVLVSKETVCGTVLVEIE